MIKGKLADGSWASLPEYHMSLRRDRCVFPGIQQCFAVVGACGDRMLCAHISPGTTPEQMAEMFDWFSANGGNAATAWFVLGPCEKHFEYGKVWKNRADVGTTFREYFGRKVRVRLRDTTKESAAKWTDPTVGVPSDIWAIEIRATNYSHEVKFDYREQFTPRSSGDWKRFHNSIARHFRRL